MRGHIDRQGRALLTIPVSCSHDGPGSPIEVWVDTGFTGDLVLPISRINELGLRASSVVETAMADGREISLDSFVAWVAWFGAAGFLSDEFLTAAASTGGESVRAVGRVCGSEVRDCGSVARDRLIRDGRSTANSPLEKPNPKGIGRKEPIMSPEQDVESTDIPPEIDDLYEGEWIAWDIISREVVAHDRELGPVVRAAKEVFDSGHPIYYHHILAPGTIIVGGL